MEVGMIGEITGKNLFLGGSASAFHLVDVHDWSLDIELEDKVLDVDFEDWTGTTDEGGSGSATLAAGWVLES